MLNPNNTKLEFIQLTTLASKCGKEICFFALVIAKLHSYYRRSQWESLFMSPLVKLYGRNLLNVRDRDRNTLERERPDDILDLSQHFPEGFYGDQYKIS